MPAFAGTAEPGAIVTILDGAAVLGSVVADAAGTWSFTPATPLSEGPHAITLTATDAAGNTGPASAPLAFSVDTGLPTQTVTIDSYTDDVAACRGPGRLRFRHDDQRHGAGAERHVQRRTRRRRGGAHL